MSNIKNLLLYKKKKPRLKISNGEDLIGIWIDFFLQELMCNRADETAENRAGKT